MHSKDQFGGFGETGKTDGVVNIGGTRLRPSTTTAPKTRPTTTTKSPLPPLPSPPIFFIDNNRNIAVNNRNQNDDLSETKADIKIIRQEQEASENGYHFLYV